VLQDATTIVQSCDACQFHAKQVHQPALGLQTIPLSWPFAVWGLDILGPFPRSFGATASFSWQSTSSPSGQKLKQCAAYRPGRQ
jgi:hypothetical protein